VALRLIVPLILLLAIGLPQSRPAASSNVPAFLYTVSKTFQPLAWMHGEDRFGADVAVFIHDQGAERPLVPGFAASADPAISFDGQRVLFAGKAHASDPWQIWEVELVGGDPKRITSGSEDCIRPFYLPDSRIVYARKRAGRFVIESAEITGGKPLALTYGPANFLPTDVLRDGRILFAAGYPLGADKTPEIYTVYSDGSGMESYRCDHGPSRHAAKQVSSGDIVFTSKGLAKFTSARAVELPIVAPAGEYAGDIAEASGAWIVPWRPDTNTSFKLMQWTPDAAELELVLDQPDKNLLQPAVLASHAVPNRHPSGLHDWGYANLLCLNAYTSKSDFAPGSIRSVRLYTRDADGNTKLLGTAPVESDGSFFVQAPSDQPLQFELLDGNGKTLKREAGFFWARRGEQRVCVGCHAGPETAPENAVPRILLKSTTPADLTGAAAPTASGGH
jgi:hypothetical protein